MKKALTVLNRLFHPPKPVLLLAPPIAFAALIYIFVSGQNNSMPVYPVYVLSAYCLTVIILPFPKLIRNSKNTVMRKIKSTAFGS